MEITFVETDFVELGTVDVFRSLLWIERYLGVGKFELKMGMGDTGFGYVKLKRYITLKDAESVMIVEKAWIHTNNEAGDELVVEGRSLESILDRRIVWAQTNLSGNLQTAVQRLLNENAISPTDTSRKISNLVFKASTNPAVTGLTINAQFNGETLLKAITDICAAAGLGFKITLSDDNKFVFELYSGSNRAYDQTANPFIVFSPEFENIINSDYEVDNTSLKTVTLVAGEGSGTARKTTTVTAPGGAGTELNRREVFTNAQDVSKTTATGTLTDAEYLLLLAQKGSEQLADQTIVTSFQGEIDPATTYEYNKDYFMGDLVQVEDKYGNEDKTRVSEYIRCQDEYGIKVYPTFDNKG